MDGGAAETGIGRPVRRREDLRLLTGKGRYSDDLNLPGQTYAVMVRSPHAHALIRHIDTEAARALPGVLAPRSNPPASKNPPPPPPPISASGTRRFPPPPARRRKRSSAPKSATSA